MEYSTEELIDLEEMCNILKCGYNAAYNLLREHKVPCFKQGRIWKIPRRGIDEYIRQQSGIVVFEKETNKK